MINSVLQQDKVDYQSAKKAKPLEVPPDLTQLQSDNRYSVPDARGGVATASSYQQRPGGVGGLAASNEPIGPVSLESMRVERNGNQRWLVVNQTPEQLWPQLKQFWADNGFVLATESAATGTMETEWTEDRSKIPQDFIRRSIGKLFDNLYSTGEKDKFRTRVERNASGATEIYITHRGTEEVLIGQSKEQTTWTKRPNDPGLEAQLLSKLMAKLSGTPDVKKAEAVVANPVIAPLHAKMVGESIEVDEGFDRAWRRVGLALDRAGFTVEDRDRVQGVYFIRYVDPDAADKKNFLTKLFNWGKDDSNEAQKFRVAVKAEAGASVSLVTVQSNDGKPETSAIGKRISDMLLDELK